MENSWAIEATDKAFPDNAKDDSALFCAVVRQSFWVFKGILILGDKQYLLFLRDKQESRVCTAKL